MLFDHWHGGGRLSVGQWFDSVEEILTPIATPPSLVHFQKEENADGASQEKRADRPARKLREGDRL